MIATLKSYPSYTDTVLYLTLLSLVPEDVKCARLLASLCRCVGSLTDVCADMRMAFPVMHAVLASVILAPVLWSLWIDLGTGNANFYWAICLVLALAQVRCSASVAFSVLVELTLHERCFWCSILFAHHRTLHTLPKGTRRRK